MGNPVTASWTARLRWADRATDSLTPSEIQLNSQAHLERTLPVRLGHLRYPDRGIYPGQVNKNPVTRHANIAKPLVHSASRFRTFSSSSGPHPKRYPQALPPATRYSDGVARPDEQG